MRTKQKLSEEIFDRLKTFLREYLYKQSNEVEYDCPLCLAELFMNT